MSVRQKLKKRLRAIDTSKPHLLTESELEALREDARLQALRAKKMLARKAKKDRP